MSPKKFARDSKEKVGGTEILEHPKSEVGDFGMKDMQRTIADPATLRAPALPYTSRIPAYDKLIRALEMKVAAAPADSQYRSELCNAHVSYGDSFAKKQDLKAAVREYRKALSVDKACARAIEQITRYDKP